MKVLELFCGTKSISKAFEARGHQCFTVDWDKQFKPTLCADIGTLTVEQIKDLCGGIPDVNGLLPTAQPIRYLLSVIIDEKKQTETFVQ